MENHERINRMKEIYERTKRIGNEITQFREQRYSHFKIFKP